MKTRFLLLVLLSHASLLLGQVPQKFNYQAVARDLSGNLLGNTDISVRINIKNLSPSGTLLYSERHDLTTSTLGLFSLQIGAGTLLSGNFSLIDWSAGDKYMETALDMDGATGGYSFTVMGATQLLSVPYALYSRESKNGWSIKGNAGTDESTDFIGTTDLHPLKIRINNLRAGEINSSSNNIYLGIQSGNASTSGSGNIGLGYQSLYSDIGGNNNVAIGSQALFSNISGVCNVAIGSGSLYSNTTMGGNIAIGYLSLRDNTAFGNIAIGQSALKMNTGAAYNIAMGYEAMVYNITGSENVAIGYQSQHSSPGGNSNVSLGYQSLYNNSSGVANVAIGSNSLFSNTTMGGNIAIGHLALMMNNGGYGNIATGYRALRYNTSGTTNNAIGYEALFNNSTGSNNTAIGYYSLHGNVGGSGNIAIGSQALFDNGSGNDNIALGEQSMSANSGGSGNTAIGNNALGASTGPYRNSALGKNSGDSHNNGAYCTFLGAYSDASAASLSNSTAIGDGAVYTASNMVRIGDGGVSVIGGAVNWSNLSDRRMKKNIHNSDLGLGFILKLRPVTYEMEWTTEKKGGNGHLGKTYTGFIAQEIEETLDKLGMDFSGLVKPQNETDYYSLRYGDFVVPLVKAVQEQQDMIEELRRANDELRQKNADFQQQVDEIKALIKK